MGSSRLAEQWQHCSELQGEYVEKYIIVRNVRFTVVVLRTQFWNLLNAPRSLY